jgi:hypothetical protein
MPPLRSCFSEACQQEFSNVHAAAEEVVGLLSRVEKQVN